jgi:hypothetical protein
MPTVADCSLGTCGASLWLDPHYARQLSVLLANGYVIAEGQIRGVREEIQEPPMQILIRCAKPGEVASRMSLY